MRIRSRIISPIVVAIAASALLASTHSAAQSRPAPAKSAPAASATSPAPSERDIASTQQQLIKLLRLTPTLTTVVGRDPSLLSNQEYVAKNNPQLADFLAAHPEVARNPDYYLFTHFQHEGGEPDEALARETWPEMFHDRAPRTSFDELISDLPPVIALVAFLLAASWMLRLFIENRRWSRVFTMQNQVHTKLIDKFSTNQELAAYMETESGKRFLEAAPIPLSLATEQRMPNAVARVLTPVQIGVVLVLLGIGFLSLRHISADMEIPMRVLGTIILMPGIGFIISAGITWLLASRLGLMPPSGEHQGPPANRYDAPFGTSERN